MSGALSGRWIVGGASARGSAHIRNGMPNQDAVAWGESGDATRLAGAIADGHGAAAHFRSDVGAAIAVRSAVSLLQWRLDDQGEDESDAAIAGEVLALWRRDVAEHLTRHPYSEAEALIPQATDLSPYGATLAAFATGDGMVVALHIGDGDLLFGYPDGTLERPLHADAGLSGEETYSLCLPDAAARFRVSTLWRQEGARFPDFLFAASDGLAKSFRDEAAFVAAVAALKERAFSDWAALEKALPDWLAEVSAAGSGDDCTVCIALARDITATDTDQNRGS